MGIEKTQVRIDTQGERQALESARRVKSEMEGISQKAQKAETDASRARSTRSRMESALEKMRANGNLKRGGFEWGPLELSAAGVGANRGWMRNNMPGFGAAFFGMAIAHGVGAGLNNLADLRDYVKTLLQQEVSTGEILNKLVHGAVQKVFDMSAATSIVSGGLRLAGYDTAVIDEAMWQTFATAKDWEQRSKAEAAANRARREAFDKLMAVQKKAQQDTQERIAKALEQNESQKQRQLAGLSQESLPVGLPNHMAQRYRAMREEEIQRQTEARNNAARREHEKLPDNVG